MPDPAPNAELMHALGRLVRGLSALFWGLPISLLVCYYTARADSLRTFGVVPPLACTGLLCFGLWQLTAFQRQERVWRSALDRALILALVNLGLSPFLYWWNQVPSQPFFLVVACVMTANSVFFLGSLNRVLQRLGAMLPDEALRHETRHFTAFNINLLVATFLLGSSYLVLSHWHDLPPSLQKILEFIERVRLWLWFVILLVLLPLSMTMALLWKTKEVILDNIFGPKP
jgi:hypothetical protein